MWSFHKMAIFCVVSAPNENLQQYMDKKWVHLLLVYSTSVWHRAHNLCVNQQSSRSYAYVLLPEFSMHANNSTYITCVSLRQGSIG